MVQFFLQTGLRLDECSQLMLSDIEFGECSGRVIVRSGSFSCIETDITILASTYLMHRDL
jgi:integrase